MPHTYTISFSVRQDECDASGHLNNAVYLRYMQEAALRASEDAGLGPREFGQLERTWLIRETEIDYLQALKAGEIVQIRTWNEGVRRSLTRRNYVFTTDGAAQPAARAWTDWIFLDPSRGRPANIPELVKKAYFPEEGDAPSYTRDAFPTIPAPPDEMFEMKRRVEWRDIDPMQHLNNAVYLSYAEDCAVRLAEHFGWPFEHWSDQGMAFVARRHRIEYLQPVKLEDELTIRTWLFDVRRTSATRYYEISRGSDGEIMTRLVTLWALINIETGRPTRFPDSFHEIIGPNIAR